MAGPAGAAAAIDPSSSPAVHLGLDTATPSLPSVSDSSGTTAVFTSFLAATSDTWKLGGDKTVNWPVGQGAAKDQGVSAAVAQTPGAITYTEQAFATQHQLPPAKIKNGGGTYVALTTAAVTAGLGTARAARSRPSRTRSRAARTRRASGRRRSTR